MGLGQSRVELRTLQDSRAALEAPSFHDPRTWWQVERTTLLQPVEPVDECEGRPGEKDRSPEGASLGQGCAQPDSVDHSHPE